MHKVCWIKNSLKYRDTKTPGDSDRTDRLIFSFCHESSMITNLRYAGKIPRKHLSVNKRISKCTRENCTQHRKSWQSSWNRWFPTMKAVTGAAVWEKRKLLKQHTVRDSSNTVKTMRWLLSGCSETDQKLIISDENVDQPCPVSILCRMPCSFCKTGSRTYGRQVHPPA